MFCFRADAVVLIENVFYIAKREINSDLAVIYQLCFFQKNVSRIMNRNIRLPATIAGVCFFTNNLENMFLL